MPGDWQELLDNCTKSGAKKGKLDELFSIRKDNVKRVKFFLQDEDIRTLLIEWMNNCLKRVKDVQVANTLRELGNHQFAMKEYHACVETYSKSLYCCPKECPEESSLALANRSAALIHLGLFEDSLKDINTALSRNYPSRLLSKILARKAKCLRNLQNQSINSAFQEEVESLKEAMKNLLVSDQQKIKKELECVHDDRLFPEENSAVLDGEIPPLLFRGENQFCRGASSALDVQFTTEKGRHMIAKEDIKAGETLFVENPNALIVLPDFRQSRCHHCTRQFGTRACHPCLDCGAVWFCSRKCREDSTGSYHSSECGLHDVLNAVGIAHLGLRIVLTFGKESVLNFWRDQSKDVIPGVDGVPYDTSAYPVAFHLTSHTELMAPEELYQYTLTAALLTLLLEQHTSFFSDNDDNIECRSIIGALILVHICQMVSNAHAITEICPVDEKSERQERIATAIYPAASLMNHSCNPTVINSFQGSRLIVRAIRDVALGEEVFNCYGPHYRRMRKSERIEALEMQYCFTCRCPDCVDEDTEDFQDLIYSFQCPSCQGSLISPKVTQGQMTKCRSCKTSQSYFAQLKADLEAVSLDARGTEAMDQGDIIQAVKLLTKCVQLRSKALFKGHPDLGRTADKLAQCYSFLGKYEECERILKISLTAVEYQFGRYSIEMANELQKYTDVLMELFQSSNNNDRKKELLYHLDEAALIYSIHYGAWSKSFKEISLKKERVISSAT